MENEKAAQLEQISNLGKSRLAEMQAAIEEHRAEWLEDLACYRKFAAVLEANYPSLMQVHGMTRAAVEVLTLHVKWKVNDGVLNNWSDHSWLESSYGDVRVVLDPGTPDLQNLPIRI